MVTTPEPAPHLDDHREWEVRIKADDEISKVFYPFNPIDVVGWKGDLTVWKINMRDIRPMMSPRAHLPPSAHTTFVTGGAVVCSFLPRPLEEDPAALQVPFFHRNTDYDEFIFYHDGDFFSKDNIRPGLATLHPRGIHHGPHPKALREPGEEDAHGRVRRDAGRAEPHPRAARRRSGGVEGLLEELDGEEVTIDPARRLDARNIYKLMVGAIVPRPIAFVSTISPDGVLNLAPFSFFTGVSANPPVICFCPMIRGSDGARKDTLRNIEATREFVVNVVSEDFAQQMNACSAEFPPEVDEFARLRPHAGAERPGAPAARGGIARPDGVPAAADRGRERASRWAAAWCWARCCASTWPMSCSTISRSTRTSCAPSAAWAAPPTRAPPTASIWPRPEMSVVWQPTREWIERTNVWRFMQRLGFDGPRGVPALFARRAGALLGRDGAGGAASSGSSPTSACSTLSRGPEWAAGSPAGS